MITNIFPEILKCIKCDSNNIHFINNKKVLVCENCENEYDITENIPIFLSKDEASTVAKSEIHQEFGTAFNYIDHYQKDAYNYDYFEKRDEGTEHFERRVREQISSQIKGSQGTILDVGCGKAWVAELFCPRGFEVISMDISLKNTSQALRRYPYKNHHAVVADAFSLPFRQKSFDYIIASEIIEHVYDPAVFIKSLFDALKSRGKLIVTTPYKEKIQYILCIHCNKPTPNHAHLHSFDEHILKSLYAGNDIKRIGIKTFGNKLLIYLRLHILLKYLNFQIWKVIDRMLNFIFNNPVRIMIISEKK